MKIVILSGAGLSAESGIQTFRDKNGLWEDYSVDEVATLKGFTANPALVHRFYNQRRRQLHEVEPNAAHYALAELEKNQNVEFFHVTQNIDDLCERAGCRNVVHLHGELFKCRCLMCASVVDWHEDTSIRLKCPECGCATEWGALRPDVVWFGEMPKHLKEIEAALAECDLFVAIGTSGAVYPAAGFVDTVRKRNQKTVLLNKDETKNMGCFDETHIGPATEIVPAWIRSLQS